MLFDSILTKKILALQYLSVSKAKWTGIILYLFCNKIETFELSSDADASECLCNASENVR